MGYFGEDFAKQFFGPGQGLKDYSHASLTFRSNGYELIPRYKFLFHVYFTINTANIPGLQNALGGSNPVSTIGLAVKSVDLPSYTVKVDTLNQYNRKRLVQSKIDYNPISIVFHDDQSDLIRNMWYSYYSYYYKDPVQSYDNVAATAGAIGPTAGKPGFGYNTRDIYAADRTTNDWGYIGESYKDGNQANYSQAQYTGKPPFFRDIKIYAINQKKFASYVLINPMITDWKHDTFDYSVGNGTMTHTMSLRYETVKYYTGAIGGTTPSGSVLGFADPAHYDTTKSSLARPGATATVFGQGGLVDAGGGVVEDLQALASGEGGLQNIIGAVQKAGTAYQTFKGKNLASIVNQEAKQIGNQVLQASLPGAVRLAINSANGQFFPSDDKKGTTGAPLVGTETRQDTKLNTLKQLRDPFGLNRN